MLKNQNFSRIRGRRWREITERHRNLASLLLRATCTNLQNPPTTATPKLQTTTKTDRIKGPREEAHLALSSGEGFQWRHEMKRRRSGRHGCDEALRGRCFEMQRSGIREGFMPFLWRFYPWKFLAWLGPLWVKMGIRFADSLFYSILFTTWFISCLRMDMNFRKKIKNFLHMYPCKCQ